MPTRRTTYKPDSSVAGVFTFHPYGNRYINSFSYLSRMPDLKGQQHVKLMKPVSRMVTNLLLLLPPCW